MRSRSAPCIGAIAVVLAVPAAAGAAAGDLTYQGCLSGEIESGPAPGGSGACLSAPDPKASGVNSGFDAAEAVDVSPDGRSVYVVSGEDDALTRFDRDPATGAISFAFCFTGETATTNCMPIPKATATGANSGLDDPESVTVSPDGQSVYVTTRNDDSIAHFSRDPATGSISYVGCLSGDANTGALGTNACSTLATATPEGADSGFDDPKTKQVLISADGRFVYAASEFDNAIVAFARNTTTGTLSFASCVTGETETSPPCTVIPGATSGGFGSGVGQPRWLELGPDDTSLYLVATGDNAFAHFSRDAATGALTFQGCITGRSTVTNCTQAPSASTDGNDSGFANPRAFVVSSDGRSAYGIGANDNALLSFSRATSGGALTYLGCLTGEQASGPGGTGACAALPTATPNGTGSGISGTRSMAISGDGLSVYTSAQNDDAVAAFDRNPATGTLAFDRCFTGVATITACTSVAGATATGDQSGLNDLETLALSDDDRSLYGASEFDDALSRFDREPAPPVVADSDPPETTLTKQPKKKTGKRRARFEFVSDEPGSTFECKLDKADFAPCTSPLRTKRLKRRKHGFLVRAIDAAGNSDASPAGRNWKVRKRRS